MTKLNHAILIRWATVIDYDELGEVMFDAVRNGESPYPESQRGAWVSAPRSDKAWHDRLAVQQIAVAVKRGVILGFISLAEQGYIDFAYIRPSAQKSGLFRKLYAQIEHKAREERQNRLWVHASLKAEPAFTAVGFQIVTSEVVSLGDQTFKRYEMEKQLG